MRKAPQGSFPADGKEPIIERIFRLVERYPSRNAAARAWGINEGTLKIITTGGITHRYHARIS